MVSDNQGPNQHYSIQWRDSIFLHESLVLCPIISTDTLSDGINYDIILIPFSLTLWYCCSMIPVSEPVYWWWYHWRVLLTGWWCCCVIYWYSAVMTVILGGFVMMLWNYDTFYSAIRWWWWCCYWYCWWYDAVMCWLLFDWLMLFIDIYDMMTNRDDWWWYLPRPLLISSTNWPVSCWCLMMIPVHLKLLFIYTCCRHLIRYDNVWWWPILIRDPMPLCILFPPHVPCMLWRTMCDDWYCCYDDDDDILFWWLMTCYCVTELLMTCGKLFVGIFVFLMMWYYYDMIDDDTIEEGVLLLMRSSDNMIW